MYISSLTLCKNDVCVYVCFKKIDKKSFYIVKLPTPWHDPVLHPKTMQEVLSTERDDGNNQTERLCLNQ